MGMAARQTSGRARPRWTTLARLPQLVAVQGGTPRSFRTSQDLQTPRSSLILTRKCISIGLAVLLQWWG